MHYIIVNGLYHLICVYYSSIVKILGLLGVVWAVLWFSVTFEKPAYHPTITVEEKKYIEEQIGHVSHSVPSVSVKTSEILKNLMFINESFKFLTDS